MICRITGVATVFALLGLTVCATAATIRPLNYDKTALSGHEIYVFKDVSLNADCSSAGKDNVSVIESPSHGTVRVQNGKLYSNFPKENERSKCNSRKVEGINGFYRSKPGFKGRDQVIFSIHTFQGFARNVIVNINVE